MRKIVFLLWVTVISTNVQSQISSGSWVLRGSSSIAGQSGTSTATSGTTSKETKSSQFNFQPLIGVFLSDFVFAGIFTDISNQKNTDETNNTFVKTSSFKMGPNVRVYFTDQKLVPFISTEFGLTSYKISQKENTYSDAVDLKLIGYYYSVGAGAEYFISHRFSFDVLLNYYGNNLSKEKTPNYTNVDYTLKNKGFEFRIGLNLILN